MDSVGFAASAFSRIRTLALSSMDVRIAAGVTVSRRVAMLSVVVVGVATVAIGSVVSVGGAVVVVTGIPEST